MTGLENTSLDLLKTFVAFAQEGTVDLAARRLELTQAAVSLQLQRFERDLGQPLFAWSGRRKILTDFGMDLFQQLVPPLRQLESALKEVSADMGRAHRPSLKVACSSALTAFLSERLTISGPAEIKTFGFGNDHEVLQEDYDIVLSEKKMKVGKRFVIKKLFESDLVFAGISGAEKLDSAPVIHPAFLDELKEVQKLNPNIAKDIQLISDEWFQLFAMAKKHRCWTILPQGALALSGLNEIKNTGLSLRKLEVFALSSATKGAQAFKKIVVS